MHSGARHPVALALLSCVLLYAGLLRFDALFKAYGPFEHPRWLAALQQPVRAAASSLTPDWQRRRVEEPYAGGDPINYLKFARQMQNFYAAHVREPGFPGATRVALMLTNDADVAVSLTSITFALLTLVATFALGCGLGSPAAGLAAAAALGIDASAVGWSIGGWRDEMFACFAVLSAWAWLRLYRRATPNRAVVAGIVSGAALLTRITSISLIAPAVVFLLAQREPSRRHPRLVGIAVAIAMAIVAPFMINCWIATGDPFYAINNHTDFYLKREGTPDPVPISAFEYALDKFERRPISAIDTVATGVFFYPFTNKWVGLDAWQKGLGTLLAVFAILGLIEWLWLGEGRLLLFMLLGALIPFSVTWTVLGGAEWRLTLFIYSFLLLAAFWFVDKVIRTAARGKPSLAPIARRLVVTAVVAMVLIVWTYAVPYAVESEALTIGSSTNILTTRRNQWLVHHGWSRPFVRGNVTARFATEPVAHMRIPLPESRPYLLVLRLHPLNTTGQNPQVVDVELNGQPLATLKLMWDPDRIGDYRLTVAPHLFSPGMNRLTFRSHTMIPLSAGTEVFPELPRDLPVGFRLWYVHIAAQ